MPTMTVRNRFDYAGRRYVRSAIPGFLVFAVVIALINIWPRIEAEIFPIIRNQAVISLDRTGDEVRVALAAEVGRPGCRVVSAGWVLTSGIHRTGIGVSNNYAGQGLFNLAPGHNLVGPLIAEVPRDFPEPASLQANLSYDCGMGWLVEQKIGPIAIPLSHG